MKNRDSFWMAVSGCTGLAFFICANLMHLFKGSELLAGSLQLCVNAFVFVTWGRAYRHSAGFKRFIAFFGIATPVIMASITVYRVIIPVFFR